MHTAGVGHVDVDSVFRPLNGYKHKEVHNGQRTYKDNEDVNAMTTNFHMQGLHLPNELNFVKKVVERIHARGPRTATRYNGTVRYRSQYSWNVSSPATPPSVSLSDGQ